MKITIITVVKNSKNTIADTIKSIQGQTYDDIEHIIVDGASTDGTLDVIRSYGNRISKVISEEDGGLWEAMNKGIEQATGDYIGFLNSDDFFASDRTVETIVDNLKKQNADAVFGYVDIVSPVELTKLIRRYRVSRYDLTGLRFGLMPAHPTFYCKRSVFEQFGSFLIRDDITPDYELMVRLLVKGKIRAFLIPEVLVVMRSGGIGNSSLLYKLKRIKRQTRSCMLNGLYTNPLLILMKYPYKLIEYVNIV